MKKEHVLARLKEDCLVAVIRAKNYEQGEKVVDAVIAGGINFIELTMTMDDGDPVGFIKKMADKYKDNDKIVIGAGTVLDPETARHAILAGAQFIIAPNLSTEVAKVCNRYQIPYAPGCTSITEAITGLEYGAAFIKAFPISDFYGPKLVSVFKTPTPFMPILASGGITLDNLSDYVKRGVDCCGFGGLLTKGTSEDIAANAKQIKTIIDETRASMK